MLALVLRRLVATIPVLLGVSVLVFLMIHLIPGDPARIAAGIDASTQDVENVRHHLGLDQPLLAQYVDFMHRMVTGDLGTSFRTGRPVSQEIGSRYGNTLLLGAAALCVAVVFGTATGVIAAVRAQTWVDNVCLVLSLVGVSMPTFALGLLAMMLFSVKLGWLPLSGDDSWKSLVLPALTLGLPSAAIVSRTTYSAMLDVLNADYVRTARAKGLREVAVIGRHALRNTLIPLITVVGLQLGYLLGGAVVTETVFAWPGVGRLMVQSIGARDFPLVQALVLLLATTFVVVNLLTDLLYLALDPRVSQQ